MPTTIARGQVTITDVYNGDMCYLSNDTALIPTDSLGNNPVLTGASTTVVVLHEGASVVPTIGTLVTSNCTASLTGVIVTINSVSADSGYVDIPVSYSGTSFGSRRFSFAKVKQGSVTYTWVKYADDASGNGMSDSPVGKRYIGIASNKPTATESTTATDYTWSSLYDNIAIGGQNLIPYSMILTTSSAYGFETRSVLGNLVAGTKYMFTFNGHIDSQASLDGKKLSAFIYEPTWTYANIEVDITYQTDTTVSASFTPTWTGQYYVNFYLYPNGGSRLGKATVNWCKLERGNIVTDWTPAPSDILLDWVKEWDGNTIDTTNGALVSPRIFAGTNSGTSASPNLTGVAIGRDVLGTGLTNVGIALYKDNVINSQLKPDGSAVFGKNAGRQLIVNPDGSLTTPKIDAGDINTGTLNSGLVAIGDDSGKVRIDANGVLVDGGSYFIKDHGGELQTTLFPIPNILSDPSFEGVPNRDKLFVTTKAPNPTYNDYNPLLEGSWFGWNTHIFNSDGTEGTIMYPYWLTFMDSSQINRCNYGKSMACVNSTNYFSQGVRLVPGQDYFISASHVQIIGPTFRSTVNSHLRIEIAWSSNYKETGTVYTNTPANFVSSTDWQRSGFSFKVPSTGVDGARIRIMSADSNWIYVDGIQLVQGTSPGRYDPIDDLWSHVKGEVGFEHGDLKCRTLAVSGDNATAKTMDVNTNNNTIATTAFVTQKIALSVNALADAMSITNKTETFIATEGQTIVNLTTGGFETGKGRVHFYLNGSRQPEDSFTETTNTRITLKAGLSAGDYGLVEWTEIINSGNIDIRTKEEVFVATQGQTDFTITSGSFEMGKGRVCTYVYGVRQPSNSFTEVSSSEISLLGGLDAGDIIIVEWMEVVNTSINGLQINTVVVKSNENPTYSVGQSDSIILCDASYTTMAITINLTQEVPHPIYIKKIDSTAHTVTLMGKIDGGTNYVLNTPNQYVQLTSSGDGWYII